MDIGVEIVKHPEMAIFNQKIMRLIKVQRLNGLAEYFIIVGKQTSPMVWKFLFKSKFEVFYAIIFYILIVVIFLEGKVLFFLSILNQIDLNSDTSPLSH